MERNPMTQKIAIPIQCKREKVRNQRNSPSGIREENQAKRQRNRLKIKTQKAEMANVVMQMKRGENCRPVFSPRWSANERTMQKMVIASTKPPMGGSKDAKKFVFGK